MKNLWAIMIALFVVVNVSLQAQNAVSTGSITGRVTDPLGAALPEPGTLLPR